MGNKIWSISKVVFKYGVISLTIIFMILATALGQFFLWATDKLK
jgi:hypothetical protein